MYSPWTVSQLLWKEFAMVNNAVSLKNNLWNRQRSTTVIYEVWISMECLVVEGNWSLEYSSMLVTQIYFAGSFAQLVKLEFLGSRCCGDVQFNNTWGLSNGDVAVDGEDGEPENFIRGLVFCGATVTVSGTILIQVQRRGTAFFLEGAYVGGIMGHLVGDSWTI